MAVRVADAGEAGALLAAHAVIPVITAAYAAALPLVAPAVVVDARKRKRARPEPQRGATPLTIGLGPNFVAGGNVDLAIETSWAALGALITTGPTLPLAGEPRPLGGHSRERFIYAPVVGTFRTSRNIGEQVTAGEPVARIDALPLLAPLTGTLRGLTHDGVPVTVGTKVIEVDARGGPLASGIGERPGRIADGVLAALAGRAAS